MNAKIVLGLGFGDEGKGLTTDYLCSTCPNPIVIRFSGGQQAGHTVILDGKKHVHSNFGSGALRGVPSYFSEHTSIYLPTFARERHTLSKLGLNPKLYVHPFAKLTTPYDVAYNRATERVVNHGSVGLGIAATMKRHNETGYKLFAMDLRNPEVLKAKLENIARYYEGLLDATTRSVYKVYVSTEEVEYLNALQHESHHIKISDYSLLNIYETLIFEGSQGIMLDMDHGIFPNVTYGNTTSKNALDVIDKMNLIKGRLSVETFYVTRCYQTRHGNGWMSNKTPISLINNKEEINVNNVWQKEFKVAEIDYKLLKYALDVDGYYNHHKRSLVITCLDQRPDFEFDVDRLGTKFFNVYESRSPESHNITKQKQLQTI